MVAVEVIPDDEDVHTTRARLARELAVRIPNHIHT
jgi:hypothetical protein